MSSIIRSNFDFLNNPWWHSDFDDRDIKYFISSTKTLQRNILSAIGNEDDLFWKGYIDYHRERYLVECISAESNMMNLTVDYVQQLLKPSWFQIFSNYIYRIIFKRHSYNAHLAKKVQNLYGAMNDIFPSMSFPNLPVDRFNPLLAQQLHKQIGDDLIDNASQYRTKIVMPAQTDFIYLFPNLIEGKMNELFRQCREKFGKEDLQLEEAIKYGACFFHQFLYIHPFINGNGRVARLLLSYLLSKFTVVPLSLYTGMKTQEICLQCLSEADNDRQFTPNALATFILENIHSTSYKICALMDVDFNDKL